MDVFRLENLLNALRFDKKIEPSAKTGKGQKSEANTPVSSSEDSVTISEEAFLKSTVEGVSREIEEENSQARKDKITQIKEEISKGEYQVPPEKVATKLTQGPDIYENLK